MNSRTKIFATAILLAAATAQAGAADRHPASADRPRMPQRLAEAASPVKYGEFVLVNGELDAPGARPAVRLYRIENGGGAVRTAAVGQTEPSVTRSTVQVGRVPDPSHPSLPEPGSWGMILAGLLGVSAIARRRMSA